jgi:hypothetical protein
MLVDEFNVFEELVKEEIFDEFVKFLLMFVSFN